LGRKMRILKALTILGLASGWTSGALAGAGSISGSVTLLGDTNVTYSIASPAMNTYVGYKFTLGNTGGNTINNISFTVTATATDPAEAVELVFESQYLPAICAKTTANAFTCNVGQLQAGAALPAFQAFFKAPVKLNNNVADTDGSDFVNVNMHVLYAEGTGGEPTSTPDNSIRDFGAPPVGLGTFNPNQIKSGVPKSGASLYTGAAGAPTPTNKSTMLAAIPALSTGQTSATAELSITRTTDDPLATNPDTDCISNGHFKECPSYSVSIPNSTFPTAPYLKTSYRVDASSLKMSAAKILNSVQIRYTGDAFTNEPVHACTNNAPTGTGLPCVLSAQCYKRSTPGWTQDLDGDCEWILINTKNGFTKFF